MSNRKRFFFLGSILFIAVMVFAFSPMHSGTALAAAAYSEPCPPTQNTGSNDTWVKVIQFNLNADHFFGIVSFPNYPLATDGNFGTNTATAVHDYQTQVMRTGTGAVGAQTWISLGFCTGSSVRGYDHSGASGGTTCPGTLSAGNSGTWVQALQQALNKDAYDNYISKGSWYPLTLDGSFGPNTTNAVKSLQSASHLITQDGIVGNQTWGAMGMCY
jgi:peptidoglycan hydrolase-like protein with peptidoglycan-binding domain